VTPSKTQIDGIVRRHLPRGWTLRIYGKGSLRDLDWVGLCNYEKRRITLRWPISSVHDVFIFLHEVGHARIHASEADNGNRYIHEYEAERYAMRAVRHEGLPVTREELKAAKQNVRERIREAEHRGVKVGPKIRRWACS